MNRLHHPQLRKNPATVQFRKRYAFVQYIKFAKKTIPKIITVMIKRISPKKMYPYIKEPIPLNTSPTNVFEKFIILFILKFLP